MRQCVLWLQHLYTTADTIGAHYRNPLRQAVINRYLHLQICFAQCFFLFFFLFFSFFSFFSVCSYLKSLSSERALILQSLKRLLNLPLAIFTCFYSYRSVRSLLEKEEPYIFKSINKQTIMVFSISIKFSNLKEEINQK